jgi:carnitine-CoA ligase
MPDQLSLETLLHRLNDPAECVLPVLLDRQAERIGDRELFLFDEGPVWTYAQTRMIARGTAAAFEGLGVRRGDRVLVLLEDGPDIVRISLGLSYIGAVMAPLNPELIGDVLTNLINYADTDLLVTTDKLAARIPAVDCPKLRRVVVFGECPPELFPSRIEVMSGDCLAISNRSPAPAIPPIAPWDVHTLFFTSGTTGVSKAVESTHMHCGTMSIDGLYLLTENDRFAIPCSYFHIGGAFVPWGIIHRGASVVIVGKFSASRFWRQVIEHRITATLLIGVMCDFLLSRPPSPEDKAHPLRFAIVQPLPRNAGEFSKRFGVQIFTQFDQTETPPAIISEPIDHDSMPPLGYCGRLRDGFEARIMDANDCEVAPGVSGELALRCGAPWVIATGYFQKPLESAKAWRNGWFHTGDIFKKDTEGRYFFVDRSKDVIRRRGENISSFDVESALVAHLDVEACAAFGVASELSEDEVMVVVQLREGARTSPEDLARHMQGSVPEFMVPKYLRIIPELPRSATDKVKKDDLRRQGVTSDTWDRDKAMPGRRRSVL